MANRTARLARCSTTRCTSLPMHASRRLYGSRGRRGRLRRWLPSVRAVRGYSHPSMESLTNFTRRMCPGGCAHLPTWFPMLRALRSRSSCCAGCRVSLPVGVALLVFSLRQACSVWPRQRSRIGDSASGHAVSCLRELRSISRAVTGVRPQRANGLASLARGLRLVACYEAIPPTGCSSPLRACCLGARADSKRLGSEPRIDFRPATVSAWSGRSARASRSSHFTKRAQRATHSERTQCPADSELA